MPTMPLFAYGTLQDDDILAAVLGRPVADAALPAAIAPGFKAVAYPGRVYPALVACAGAAAPGRLIHGLDALDLAALDAFEGDEYRRASIAIACDGTNISAYVYLPLIDIAPNSPSWSFQHWLSHHKPGLIEAETRTARNLRQRLGEKAPR